MKAVVKIEKEVELKTLVVEAGVRYWEDAEVNGENDTEYGTNIPCKEGDLWKPIIDLETGVIKNWEQGKTANVHYKVCDAGSYYLQDADGNTILSIDENYVPDIMCPEGEGYGDYIKMKIDENGKIANWEQTLTGFQNED
jgi:hypothetical protein